MSFFSSSFLSADNGRYVLEVARKAPFDINEMLAVIHRTAASASAGIGLADVAGVLLLARQVQWLKAIGAFPIAVEIGDDPASSELAEWILEYEEDGLLMIPTATPIGPRALAERAGSPEGVAFLAIPENVIGDSDLLDTFLRNARSGAIVMFGAPRGVSLPYGSIRIVGERGGSHSLVQGRGWAVRLGSVDDARALGEAAERGMLPTRDRDHFAPLEVSTLQGPANDAVLASAPSSGVHLIAPNHAMADQAYARIVQAASGPRPSTHALSIPKWRGTR